MTVNLEKELRIMGWGEVSVNLTVGQLGSKTRGRAVMWGLETLPPDSLPSTCPEGLWGK